MTAREDVERAYDGVLELLAGGDVQHLHPYQLRTHVERLRAVHLGEAVEAEGPDGDPPDAAPTAAVDWRESGRQARRGGQERKVPEGQHPRSREGREWLAGYDETETTPATTAADGGA